LEKGKYRVKASAGEGLGTADLDVAVAVAFFRMSRNTAEINQGQETGGQKEKESSSHLNFLCNRTASAIHRRLCYLFQPAQ